MNLTQVHAQSASMQPFMMLSLSNEKDIFDNIFRQNKQGFRFSTNMQPTPLSYSEKMSSLMLSDCMTV
jgi:hypothetical protein